jgi:mevalonate kinase
MWPIPHILKEKATVNFGIDLLAQVRLRSTDRSWCLESLDQGIVLKGSYQDATESPKVPLISMVLKQLWSPKLPPLHLTTSCASPKGAGLGGSSALAIALIRAFIAARQNADSTFEATLIDEKKTVQLASDIEAKIIHARTPSNTTRR